MRVELFPFQKRALADIRMKTAEAMGSYHRTHAPQVVSFTAPTGAGKTIIMSALIEAVLFGDEQYMEQPNAIIVWLSDSPQLNEQSKQKIDSKADKIKLPQCVTISEESFDKEVFEDGHVYFLNTQKLSVTSKLTKNGDGRTYTIWQTLANTVWEKSDRLYFIIDEAHRGMQGREASRATTIMQKFIKGSEDDGIPPMPVVIGMSATTQRFNALVEGTSSTIHKSIVTTDEVRASGLLKDRIVITYPEEGAVNNDMAILQAAADDWKEKWEHWTQYCFEQHYAYVNPILIIQVLNGTDQQNTSVAEDMFNREEVMKFINDAGLLSYNIRALRINDYLKSLYRMAHLLTMSKLHREAIREVQDEIVEMIHNYVEGLKTEGKYDDLVQQVKQFKLETQIFDAFGETVDNYSVHNLFTTTDSDIERQFRIADIKLGREGIGMAYGNKYMDMSDTTTFKVDVILFVADEECMNRLHSYAETRFHDLNDEYRRYIATIDSEKIRKDYDSIVSDGDSVSKHNFRLPETIQVPHEVGGREYRNHLFVSDITGVATMKLNTWEAGVIEEEEKREDFVCWIRNPSRGSWALCIPYEIDGEIKPTYPDFIIVRKDRVLGYVVDILEPHNPDFKDNLGKAKGFAEYARKNPGVGRIQLIRMSKDAAGKHKFKRLDMSKTAIRDKVSHAINTDELDHIFDTDGVIE